MTPSKVRTPKPFFFRGYMIQFRTKRKEVFYNVSVWNESGTRLSLIKSEKYNGEKPELLITKLINGEGNLEAQK